MSEEPPDNVVILNTVTSLDIPVERVLAGAMKAELTEVIVIGYRPDGTEFFAASKADGPSALWLLERTKAALLEALPGDAE